MSLIESILPTICAISSIGLTLAPLYDIYVCIYNRCMSNIVYISPRVRRIISSMSVGSTPYLPYLCLLFAQVINGTMGYFIHNTTITYNSIINMAVAAYYCNIWYTYASF